MYVTGTSPSLPLTAQPVSFLILRKQLKVEGFFCLRWLDNCSEAFRELAQWIQEVMDHFSLNQMLSVYVNYVS